MICAPRRPTAACGAWRWGVVACTALAACSATDAAAPSGGAGGAGAVGGVGGAASGGTTSGGSGGAPLDAGGGGSAPCTGASTPPSPAVDVQVAPGFAGSYVVYDLGAVPGMPASKYGGLTLLAGDRDTLLVGANANDTSGAIYAVPLQRGCGEHILGFAGPATRWASAPYIDGGLAYGPGGALFFTAYPTNDLGVLSPGAASPSTTLDVDPLGVAHSLGALAFVPPGLPREGALKLVSWGGGQWYDADVVAGPAGQPALANLSPRPASTLPGGPEGMAWVPAGSPEFAKPSLVVSEWTAGTVGAFEMDGAADPIVSTRRAFLFGLTGAEGAYFDPPTGDYLFTTWQFEGTERVVLVQGFAPIDPPR
ncbi:MAG: hypothetical protein IT376_00340 [Polyangiaceae bacterium]|nr:hypothetical protein [Polyangiaceae bacterium]